MAERLQQGRPTVANKSSHWIMQDQLELVVEAVREVARAENNQKTTIAGR